MASTVAKFTVQQITRHQGQKRTAGGAYEPCEQHTYQLGAVYSQDPNHENRKFWEATPSGQITLTAMFPHEVFGLGKELYVIFTDEKPEGQ